MIVAIDSMALVHATRRGKPPELHKRALWLFNALAKTEAQVVLPAIALSEYLTNVDPGKHAATVAALSKRFMIAPFDARCVALAAKLFQQGKSGRAMKQPDARKTLRADCLIVATVHSFGVRRFYSADKDCRNLAEKVPGLEVFDLPTQPESLFEYGDEADA